MDSTTQLGQITEKIKRLSEVLGHLRNENEALKRENAQLKTKLSNHVERINVLELELDNKQADWTEQEKINAGQSEQLKKKIDLYISEIDRCIEWLQNE